MDKNISAVSQLIGNLRNMAIDMGNEIAHQTQVINHADIKVSIFSFAIIILDCIFN